MRFWIHSLMKCCVVRSTYWLKMLVVHTQFISTDMMKSFCLNPFPKLKKPRNLMNIIVGRFFSRSRKPHYTIPIGRSSDPPPTRIGFFYKRPKQINTGSADSFIRHDFLRRSIRGMIPPGLRNSLFASRTLGGIVGDLIISVGNV